MSLLRFYIQHEKLILPTVAETEDGFYLDTAPVEIFPIADASTWTKALYKRLVLGNDLIPTPDQCEEPGSAILEALKIAKWSTFETTAVMFSVQGGGRYINIYRTGKGSDSMWSHENMGHRQFDPRTPLSTILRALIEDIIKQPEANRPRTGLMTLRPTPSVLDTSSPETAPTIKLLSSDAVSEKPS